MEFETQDRKVVELLTKLKGADEGYPSDMLAARRQAFLNNMAGASLGVGTGTALNRTLKGGGGSGAAPITMGKLLEVALLIAIVVEAGALAYFYRDKVADVFRSLLATSKVQEIVSPPVITSPFPELEISKIPTSVTPTGTASEVATSAQVPGVADDPTVIDNNSNPTTVTESTPEPNGNNGNHYGQTPKPERTKDNKDNQPQKDNPGNGDKDKPPKEEKDKKP